MRDVSLEVPEGSIIALVGANGAGKSTLIRTCLGFERPDEGRVLVFGIDPRRDWAWRTPDGVVISKEAAAALVLPELVAQDDGLVQLMHTAAWLDEHGYIEVSVGISTDVAFG